MSQDLKKLLQQPPIPPSLITSFLKPSQMGALSEASKKTRASTRQAQTQIQQLDGSSVTNVQQFIRKFASFPLLKKLIFPRTIFTPDRVELLTEMLTRLPELTYVDLSINQVRHAILIVLSQNFPTIQFKVGVIKPNGDIIKGNMVNGVFQGPAKLYYVFGDRLEGNMVDGVFQGPVKRYYINGDRLQGNMVDGEFQGPATRYYTNGYRLEGNMVRGIFQGPGIKHFTNGDRMEGNMVHELFEGPVIYYYANGDRLEGNREFGVFQGPATLYYANGGRLEGNMEGYFQGPAIYYYPNGDRIEGNKVNGTWQGLAIKYFTNGTHEQGHIQRGRFIPNIGPPPAKKRRSLP